MQLYVCQWAMCGTVHVQCHATCLCHAQCTCTEASQRTRLDIARIVQARQLSGIVKGRTGGPAVAEGYLRTVGGVFSRLARMYEVPEDEGLKAWWCEALFWNYDEVEPSRSHWDGWLMDVLGECCKEIDIIEIYSDNFHCNNNNNNDNRNVIK